MTTKKSPTESRTARVSNVDRRDARDAAAWAEDLLIAMIMRERVATAAQPPETRTLWQPGQTIEARLRERLGRFRTVDELLANVPANEIDDVWSKLNAYTLDRARELLDGAGAKLRKRRRAREVPDVREKLKPLAGLPRTSVGRELLRNHAALFAATRQMESLDLAGVPPDVIREQAEKQMAEAADFAADVSDSTTVHSAGISQATIGRALGVDGAADKDVAKEVDRLDSRKAAPGMLGDRPLDRRLLKE